MYFIVVCIGVDGTDGKPIPLSAEVMLNRPKRGTKQNHDV